MDIPGGTYTNLADQSPDLDGSREEKSRNNYVVV